MKKIYIAILIIAFMASLSVSAETKTKKSVKVDKFIFGAIKARAIGPAVMSGRISCLDAVHENPRMRPIVTRHEQGAAFMADGYARASRKAGVAVTISGNGFMNAMTHLLKRRPVHRR